MIILLFFPLFPQIFASSFPDMPSQPLLRMVVVVAYLMDSIKFCIILFENMIKNKNSLYVNIL